MGPVLIQHDPSEARYASLSITLHEPPPWMALTVKHQHEQAVRTALEGKGFKAYAPTCRAARRWSDRLKELDLPLFPGYVFCRWHSYGQTPLLRTPGVRTVVSFGGEIAPIPDSEIARIRRALASGLTVEPWPFLKAGQRVRIEAGPLAGVEGTLVEVRDKWRVVLNVEMLQRSVAVHVTRDTLVPVGPPPH
jgi:transcription antitermination factor NusG